MGNSVVPVNVRDEELSGDQGALPGYSFEAPWSNPDNQSRMESDRIARVIFGSGQAVGIIKSPADTIVKSFTSKAARGPLERIYGKNALSSDYSFVSEMLNDTPKQIGPFTPRLNAVKISTLLTMKSTILQEQSGIYAIHTPYGDGFQYGSATNSKKIKVDVYGESAELALYFSTKGTAEIRQEDINRVLQTLKFEPDQNVSGK